MQRLALPHRYSRFAKSILGLLGWVDAHHPEEYWRVEDVRNKGVNLKLFEPVDHGLCHVVICPLECIGHRGETKTREIGCQDTVFQAEFGDQITIQGGRTGEAVQEEDNWCDIVVDREVVDGDTRGQSSVVVSDGHRGVGTTWEGFCYLSCL